MSFYEAAAAGLLLTATIFYIGALFGAWCERQEWQDYVAYLTNKPTATKKDLDLIFRLDQRK